MCNAVANFFHPERGGLAVEDPQELVLDCYRLARWYHQSPEHFLAMPLEDVALHRERTAQVSRLMRAQAEEE
jgi:hypothetical protein